MNTTNSKGVRRGVLFSTAAILCLITIVGLVCIVYIKTNQVDAFQHQIQKQRRLLELQEDKFADSMRDFLIPDQEIPTYTFFGNPPQTRQGLHSKTKLPRQWNNISDDVERGMMLDAIEMRNRLRTRRLY